MVYTSRMAKMIGSSLNLKPILMLIFYLEMKTVMEEGFQTNKES